MRGIGLLACLLIGCASGGGGLPKAEQPAEPGVSIDIGVLTPAVLDQLTKSYADEYVTLVGTACEYVVIENPDIDQRRLALRFRSLSATAMYDIVTNEDPFTQLVDLVVAVSLQCRIWIDDGQADDFFGDRADYVVDALYEARRNAWELAARAFTPEQLSMLDGLIWIWRARNPDVRLGCFIRFTNFADSRAKSIIQQVRQGGGLLRTVSAVKQTADELKRLGDRVFFISKRSPVLLEWQLEQALTEMLAQPEIRKVVDNQDELVGAIRRTADTVDELPEVVARERKAILDEIDAKSDSIGELVGKGESLVKEVRGAVADGETLLKQTDTTLRVLKETLEVADRLAARIMPAITEAEPDPDAEPFRIAEYTATLQELTKSLIEANKLLAGTDELLRQEAWKERIEEVASATDRLVESAAAEGVSVTTAGLWRTIVLMVVFFVLLGAYRVFAVRVSRAKA